MIIVGDKNGGIYGHKKTKAVIGTNSWGGAVAAKVFCGSSVDDQTLRKTIDTAKEKELPILILHRFMVLEKHKRKWEHLVQKVLLFLQNLPHRQNIHQGRFVNLWSGIWQNLGGAMWIFTGCTVRLTQKITLPR